MKILNNKGYMLIEIIMAFAVTFGILYFMMDLVINFKNRNNDLFAETLIKTDVSIITNKLMSYAMEDVNDDVTADKFCKNIEINGNFVKYKKNVVDEVDNIAIVSKVDNFCNVNTDIGKISINIPVSVNQIKDKKFNIVMDYNYK